MADQNLSGMQMHMDELHSKHGVKKDESKKKHVRDERHADVAALYEDAWEYEKDLECFENELKVIKNNPLSAIAEALTEYQFDPERNYAEELDTVLENAWTQRVEVEQTHPAEQLTIIKASGFTDAPEKLKAAYPDYSGDFDKEIMEAIVKRWEMLIEIKKEHIEEEIDEIKTAGLKPYYVKRIYKEYHGID
jgi:hypothetical protein